MEGEIAFSLGKESLLPSPRGGRAGDVPFAIQLALAVVVTG